MHCYAEHGADMRRSPKHDHGFQRFECSLQPLALTNIVTQFFWATCFLFLLRALWSRRRSDWALAGLSAGLSEYFYYGTRLLPFISAMFMVFLVAVHRKHARQYVGGFLLLAGSYFVGFGGCCFTSVGTQTSTWGDVQASRFGHRTFRSVSLIFTALGQ
ncbi:MAG: hypothetical protein DMF05_09100 [Verrucomicrobia bacterium]|nr:MAG: hypothetical protein DMF05_09100 [Verrucomicrobiota bacterium]